MFVKICGIKTADVADACCSMGADAVGIVAYRKSRRYITPEEASAVKEAIGGRCPLVVVGVTLLDCMPFFHLADYFQAEDANTSLFHVMSGSERPAGLFKYFLYDASRGAGLRTDYPEWIAEFRDRLILAGGLSPENVSEVTDIYKPFGVDVSSGVETDGVKDIGKIEEFIKKAKGL